MNTSNVLRYRVVVLMLLVLGAGFALGVTWSSWRESRQPTGDDHAIATASAPAATTARRVLYWHDPMKPEVRFDKPGKSPFMDMPLVPVYADEDQASGAGQPQVRVSAAAQQQFGIRLGRAERAAISAVVRGAGTVAYDEAAQVVVQPRADGFVKRLAVRTALQRVRRGQLIAEAEIPAWREALGEYLALLPAPPAAGAAAAPSGLQSALRQRLAILGVPDEAVVQVEQSRALPASFSLSAPIDGVVTALDVREGAAFAAGTVVARISRTDPVWVDVQLPAAQVRAVAIGDPVRVSVNAEPGKVYGGKVLGILPQLDAATRTIGVRVAVGNGPGLLRPGQYAEALFPGRAAPEQIWVPSEAVITTGERSVVIVARGGGFSIAEVHTGVETEGRTAIVSGLAAGESVVLSGQFLIDSEANLKSTFERLAAPGAGP